MQKNPLHRIRIQNMHSVFEFNSSAARGTHMGGCNAHG
jgi:hypothetical protein